jgi:hypothetical protein
MKGVAFGKPNESPRKTRSKRLTQNPASRKAAGFRRFRPGTTSFRAIGVPVILGFALAYPGAEGPLGSVPKIRYSFTAPVAP